MQLRALALYSHDGRVRPLPLRTGKLNVISGLSRTGKTELIKIIDYCAGRSDASLAPGPITDKVSWFVAIFEAADGRQVLVGRPQPSAASSTSAMVHVGRDLELPADNRAFAPNSNRGDVRAALDGLLGLGTFDLDQYAGVRDRLRASVSHAIQFCLQSQTELMAPDFLFHRGRDPRVAADFAELFPYFLGTIDEDVVDARRRATQLRRELTRLDGQYERLESRQRQDQGRDRTLLGQAQTEGLLPAGTSDDDPRQALSDLIRLVPAAATGGPDRPPLVALQARSRAAGLRVRELRERREALAQLTGSRDDHRHALERQAGRLGLVPEAAEQANSDPLACPACGQPVDDNDSTIAALARDADALAAQLASMTTATRDLAPADRELAGLLTQAEEEYAALRAEVRAMSDSDQANAALLTEQQRRARLLGVIEEYLRTVNTTTGPALAALEQQRQLVREQLEAAQIGSDRTTINAEIDARLSSMSLAMTDWARRLELENASAGTVAIDRRSLNVAISTGRGRIGLERMGSGANHVGYHLVAHLALHQHFVQEERPVPHFLVIDQPSLPFFPRGVDRDEGAGDVDWGAVRTMMLLANEVCAAQDGALQILITDHADFAGESWYDEALVEDWHTGTKLVPDDWPDS